MLTPAELEGMRHTSRSALPATCRITRPNSNPVLDPVTGAATASSTLIFEGPCRVRTLHTQDMAVQFGGLHEAVSRYVLTLPHDATGVQVDDYVTVTGGTDEDLAGRSLRVTDVQYSEWQVDRRIILEDQQKP